MYTLELCWSKIKEFLKSQATRTYSALDEALTAAINAIAPQDIRLVSPLRLLCSHPTENRYSKPSEAF
jgi:hypothetical protein